MSDRLITGIMGRARSGKDTFAEMLADELFELVKGRFVLMAYAQELKVRVQKDFDLRYEQLWGDEKEEPDQRYIKYPPEDSGELIDLPMPHWTGREILQAYGQFYRTIDRDFWVKNLFKVIDDKDYKRIIITDIRHPNEAWPVKNAGGFVIKVVSNREGIPKIHGESHISETAMDDFDDIDLTINNDLGLDELRSAAKSAAEFIVSMKKINMEVSNGNSS